MFGGIRTKIHYQVVLCFSQEMNGIDIDILQFYQPRVKRESELRLEYYEFSEGLNIEHARSFREKK